MRSIAQLTAGARHAAAAARPPDERSRPDEPQMSEHRAFNAGSGRPVAPSDGSREGLLRLIETIAPRLGLGDKALRALRVIVTACRWADFVDPSRDPVCFRQQQRMAAEIGVTPGHFRKIEAQLEAAGLIERRTTENGHRGQFGSRGLDGPVAGLSLEPLLAGLPRWQAMANAMAREAQTLSEGRILIRIERRAARHAVEGLGADHPVRWAYEALRGEAFPPSAGYRTAAAIAAHLEALRGVIEEAAAGEESIANEADTVPPDGQDEPIWSGAPRAEERRHTEDTTDPQTGFCSRATAGQGRRDAHTAAPRSAEGSRRERNETEVKRTEVDPGEGEGGEGRRTPPTRLPPALARRLTPAMLREMGCEEMRLWIDHLGTHTSPPKLRDVERAALVRRRELGITPQAWEEAEATLGWLDALVALIVVDRNRTHPRTPVRNPGGLLRDLARRRRAGTLDLGASIMGIWQRKT